MTNTSKVEDNLAEVEEASSCIRELLPEEELLSLAEWLKDPGSGSFSLCARGGEIIGHDQVRKKRKS